MRLAGALRLRRPPQHDAHGPYRGARPDDNGVVLVSIAMVTPAALVLSRVTSRDVMRDHVARFAEHAFRQRDAVAGYFVCMPGNPDDALDAALVLTVYRPPVMIDLG
jgi:hypothetical protein